MRPVIVSRMGRLAGFLIVMICCVVIRAQTTRPDIRGALAATRDVWGEQAMRQPNGASYKFFEKLLPPLRYVNTDFRHYPIALAAPFAPVKARLVSNGSGVNLSSGTKRYTVQFTVSR